MTPSAFLNFVRTHEASWMVYKKEKLPSHMNDPSVGSSIAMKQILPDENCYFYTSTVLICICIDKYFKKPDSQNWPEDDI
jgi:hypothetical protein